MSNFLFVKTTLPLVHADCVRAESGSSAVPVG